MKERFRLMKIPVTHHSDGREAWDKDLYGFIRIRGIVLSVIVTISFAAATSTGAPWWITLLPSNEHALKLAVIITIVLTIFSWGIVITYGLLYLRKRTIRSLKVKYLLHQLAHRARDIQASWGKNPREIDFKTTIQTFASLVQEYFKELIWDKDNTVRHDF